MDLYVEGGESPSKFAPRKYVPVVIANSETAEESLVQSKLKDIPDDVRLHLLSFLPPKELMSTSLVCRKFKALCDSDKIWKSICMSRYGTNLIKLQNQSYRSLYFQIQENNRCLEQEKAYIIEEDMKQRMHIACGIEIIKNPSHHSPGMRAPMIPPPQRELGFSSFTPIGGFSVHPNSTGELTIKLSTPNLGEVAKALYEFLSNKSNLTFHYPESILRYHNFMKLKVKYPDLFLVPTYEIESVWISHLLRPLKYREDCTRLYGHVIDHQFLLSEVQKQFFDSAVEQTCQLYQQEYGVPYCELPSKEEKWKFSKDPFGPLVDTRSAANYTKLTSILQDKGLSSFENPFSFTEKDLKNDEEWLPYFQKYVQGSSHYWFINQRFIDRMLKSYERFLYMATKFPPKTGTYVHPTYAMDLIWHSHMLDPLSYYQDCKRLCGYLVDHEPWPNVDLCEMKSSFKDSAMLWKNEFGVDIDQEHMLDNPPSSAEKWYDDE